MNIISKSVTAVAAALVMIGCAGAQDFKPAERATARSPEGYQAALYQIAGRDGVVATARVWTLGTSKRMIQGQEHTVVQVAFEIQNHTSRPLRMNIAEITADLGIMQRPVVEDVRAIRASGSLTIEPRATQRIDVYFPLPADVRARQLDAFQVKWKLRDARLTYSQETPFVEDETEAYAYYYTPFYDPFLYDHYWFHPRILVHHYPYRHIHVLR